MLGQNVTLHLHILPIHVSVISDGCACLMAKPNPVPRTAAVTVDKMRACCFSTLHVFTVQLGGDCRDIISVIVHLDVNIIQRHSIVNLLISLSLQSDVKP